MTAEKKPNNTKSSAKSKTSNNKKSKKISKGNFGYFKSEKKRRLIITAILFAVPLFIFFTSWIYFKTRMTVWTVVAVVGCLPACQIHGKPDHDPEMQTNGCRTVSENPGTSGQP